METKVKNAMDTPEARDAQRLKALPIILAVELAHHREHLQPHDLISHDELEEAVRATLGLELAESAKGLYDEINAWMCEWHWQWMTFDCMLQQFYAQPDEQRANLSTLAGNRFVLQPAQVFPSDLNDVSNCLWQSDFAVPFIAVDDEDDQCEGVEHATDDMLFTAFGDAHLINPLGANWQ